MSTVKIPSLHIGIKMVIPIPMTRLAYNHYRNWTLPENENGDDPGYLVEYLDGGTPNDPRHQGYISWSPKEVFDKSYRPLILDVHVIKSLTGTDDKSTLIKNFLMMLFSVEQLFTHARQTSDPDQYAKWSFLQEHVKIGIDGIAYVYYDLDTENPEDVMQLVDEYLSDLFYDLGPERSMFEVYGTRRYK